MGICNLGAARPSGPSSAAAASTGSGIADLVRGFQNPPDDSKIMMRWWWFGPAVTTAGIEREMGLMKQGGIGGFEVQPVYPVALDDAATGIRNLRFLSDEYIDMLRFTAEKAREMGLRFDLTLGSGWPYGGPQVPVSQAAGMLRVERVKVNGSSERVPLPSIGAGEGLIGAYLAVINGQTITRYTVLPVTGAIDGGISLPPDFQGPRQVLFFISGRTGMQVKRPAVGAEGFVVNHYDRSAVQNYLNLVGDRLFQAFGNDRPYSIFCDSLEVYNSDWTDDLLDEFRKRRGYSLETYLPALVADIGPQTAAIRCDWGRTLTELFNERFLGPMREWSERNHTRFRIQCYGIPPAVVSSNAYADLPEGEGSEWKVLRASRWASSASHLYGRQITSSETWTWLHSPVFRASPLDMKAEADRHFLQGINQLVGHGWPYTAPGVEYPGWRFYASAVFDEKNPWWIVMPDIALYLQRISFLMRQGQPANDVALYLPNCDAWAHFSAGHVHMIETLRDLIGPDIVARLLESGYDFDFFDDDSLRQTGRIEKAALALGPNKYRIVVLPGVERIPPDTLQKLEEFARSGGILIATRRIPEAAPGLLPAAEQSRVNEIANRLFQGASAPAHFVESEGGQLEALLTGLLGPDVRLTPGAPDIGFVHRRTADAEIYFLANTSNVRRTVTATFRVGLLQGQWWDPFSGRVSPADSHRAGPNVGLNLNNDGTAPDSVGNDGVAVPLDIEPYGSRVLVFSRTIPPYRAPAQQHSAVPPALDLSAGWSVSFGQAPPVAMERLRPWTEDPATRYFSGLATYQNRVVVPDNLVRDDLRLTLDLGEGTSVPVQSLKNGMQAWLEPPVREAAVVYINDRKAGSVWCPPYSVDVTGLVKPGENNLRIVVANLAINYMAGRKLPDYRLLNLRYGERFQPQDMDKVQPVTAGLLGPIRLIATTGPSAK
jgi:hypothetical protein